MNLIVETILILAGAWILAAALVPLYRLIRRLPPGSIRSRWILLRGLNFFFIAGYIAYAAFTLVQGRTTGNLAVSIIFLLGSIFVYVSSWLSFQTAVDIRRISELELENTTDPLTGIYNRRYLDRRLQEEFARARRYNLPLAVLLIDLDHFKSINDIYGHPAGDATLGMLAKLMHSSLRSTDILARYGGDEFMVIAVNTNGQQAYVLAERLRTCVADHQLKVGVGDGKFVPVSLTLSIGLACCTSTSDVQGLVEEADRMMYQAKEAGRNRTMAGKTCQGIAETAHSEARTRAVV